MSQKYAAFDQKLFTWLAENRTDVTTSRVNQELEAETSTLQRHISRRFTQLEDRGVLKCRLEGTTRVCTVEGDLPTTLAKQRWRPKSRDDVLLAMDRPQLPSIKATTSDEFEAAGGVVTRLPTQWDRKPHCNAVGMISIDHILADLD